MTPSGIETGRNITGARRRTGASTKAGALERPAATFECNECNEALEAARGATAAHRLALVAENALINGDLRRARAILRDLHHAAINGQRWLGPLRTRGVLPLGLRIGRVKLWVVGGVAMVGLAGLPTLAAADGPPLGADGQFVLSAERLIGVSRTWATRPGDMMGPQTTSTTNVTILSGTPAGSGLGGFLPAISFTFPRVAADYFVTGRLSLGAAVGYFHSSNPGVTTSTTFSASGFILDPRAGLVFPVTANVTILAARGFELSERIGE